MVDTSKVPWKATEPVEERKKFIEDWLAGGHRDVAGLSRTYRIRCKAGHKRIRRFLAGGYPGRLGECQWVTHRVDPTSLRPQSTDQIINAVAGRLALSDWRPRNPESLFHKILSRSRRHDRPKRSTGLRLAERIEYN